MKTALIIIIVLAAIVSVLSIAFIVIEYSLAKEQRNRTTAAKDYSREKYNQRMAKKHRKSKKEAFSFELVDDEEEIYS
jgi:mannitol-specific phosphotransferase system IIBC component